MDSSSRFLSIHFPLSPLLLMKFKRFLIFCFTFSPSLFHFILRHFSFLFSLSSIDLYSFFLFCLVFWFLFSPFPLIISSYISIFPSFTVIFITFLFSCFHLSVIFSYLFRLSLFSLFFRLLHSHLTFSVPLMPYLRFVFCIVSILLFLIFPYLFPSLFLFLLFFLIPFFLSSSSPFAIFLVFYYTLFIFLYPFLSLSLLLIQLISHPPFFHLLFLLVFRSLFPFRLSSFFDLFFFVFFSSFILVRDWLLAISNQ